LLFCKSFRDSLFVIRLINQVTGKIFCYNTLKYLFLIFDFRIITEPDKNKMIQESAINYTEFKTFFY